MRRVDVPTTKISQRSERSPARAPKFIRLIDQNEKLPIHERLYRRVRQLILSGALAGGSRLASSRALAASLGISRNSVLTALDRLIADGWLETRRNSGVYVSYTGLKISAPIHSDSDTGQETVPFALGWPADIFPVKTWKRLQMRSWHRVPDGILLQGEPLGVPALRAAIAAYVAVTRGLECSAHQVIITTSIPSGIDLAVRALGLSGSEIWVEDPCDPAPFNALLRSGVRLVPVPVDKRGIDVEAGKRSVPNAKMAFLTPTCQAPTGVTLSDERRNELIRWAEMSSAWIFEDDFNWNGDGIARSQRPVAVFDPVRTIYFNSFNSILFSGLRIAYIIVPLDLVDRFAAVRGTEGDVNTANQMVLTDFIDGGYLDDHQRRLDACNAERRAAVSRCVQQELSGFLTSRDAVGGYFICTLNSVSEPALLEATRAAGPIVTGMSAYRMMAVQRDEIILGYSQHKPAALSAAAIKLRSVLESI
jgi:GntR family transcriptional regulator/MocR family aminotransferase